RHLVEFEVAYVRILLARGEVLLAVRVRHAHLRDVLPPERDDDLVDPILVVDRYPNQPLGEPRLILAGAAHVGAAARFSVERLVRLAEDAGRDRLTRLVLHR